MPSTITDRLTGINTSTAIKAPVRVTTTANITLSGEQTIDGVAIVDGDRVLVKDQTNAVDNGIYVASTGAWERAKDFDGTLDVRKGTLVFASGGSVGGGLIYQLTTADTVDIGTDNITFTVLSAYTATAFIQTLLDDANATAAQTTLGLLIGTNVQAYDAELAALAGLTSAANTVPTFSGSGTAALVTLAASQLLARGASGNVTNCTLGTSLAFTAAVLNTVNATQANQEAGSDTTTLVTSGRQHFHPSAAKAWVNFTGTGTVTINASSNVTSVTDNGTGDYTVNFTTAFSTAYYGFDGMCGGGTGGGASAGENLRVKFGTLPTTSAFRLETTNVGNTTNVDAAMVGLSFFGDFA